VAFAVLASVLAMWMSFLSGAAHAEDKKLTKLTPDQLTIHTNNGSGSLTIVYALPIGEAPPKIEWADAHGGGGHSIPKEKIAMRWADEPQRSTQWELRRLDLTVGPQARLEPNVDYKGKIIVLWPDGTPPQTEDFTIREVVGAIDFGLSVSKLDAVLFSGQPSDAQFIVSNTGQGKISKLSFSSTDLESAATHRHADFGPLQEQALALPSGREQTVSLQLPRPSYAGTYTGTLNVIANNLSHVDTATAGWPGTALKPVIDDLDAVPFPGAKDDMKKYRDDLGGVLEKHVATRSPQPPGAPMFSMGVPVEQLELQIERMALVHHAVLGIVIFTGAYTTLYWNNLDFGTLLDYLNVFLWAVGLTKTGTDVLTRAKSSYSPV
jgi:hypothetical protein